MAWVRIEDSVTDHPKHLKAGPAASWLWVCGLAYCQRQLSDGFIPVEAIGMIGVTGVGRCRKLADVLVGVGLFDVSVGGYRVHDYHEYNDTKEEAIARRDKLNRDRVRSGRVGGLRSGEARRLLSDHANEANVKHGASVGVEANTKELAAAKRSPLPSHPIPSQEIQECVSSEALPIAQMTPPRRPIVTGAVYSTQMPSEEIRTRAAAFVKRYTELYPLHRHGARYYSKPAVDYDKAMGLCETWPDDRLDKLATIFLKCQEPFAAGGSRTIGQFAAMASWCDGRLAEVERGVAS